MTKTTDRYDILSPDQGPEDDGEQASVVFGIQGRIVLLVGSLVIVTGLAITAWIFQKFNGELLASKIRDLKAETALQELSFKAATRELKEDVTFLEGTPPVQGIIRARSAGGIDPLDGSTRQVWQQRLSVIFTRLLQAKPDYLQARYVGVAGNGREIVRVDRHGENNSIRVVPEEELQEKGDRGYFKRAIGNPAGKVSLSDIDLNREQGKVMQPLVPVLRASIPVYSVEGNKIFGIIVINQDMRTIFSDLMNVANSNHTYFITNQRGDYLLHPDPSKAFSFEFGKEDRFQDDFPEFAGSFSGKVGEEKTLIHANPDGTAEIVSLRLVNYDPSDPSKLLGVAVSGGYADVTKISTAVKNQVYLIIAVLILIALVVGLLFARGLAGPIREITRAVREFAMGYRVLSLPLQSKTEAGILARAFHDLIEQIRDRSRQLQEEVIEREKAERYANALVDYASDAIITIDTSGLILSFNHSAEKLFGYVEEEVIGKNVSLLMPSPHREEHDTYIDRYLLTGEKKIIGVGREVKALHRDGREIQIELTVAEIKVGDHHIFMGSMRDITERKRVQDKLAYHAHYDSLTGLPNRTLFRDRLHRALIRARRNGSRVALMFIDLDGFKGVNDNLGHDVGDVLLKEVASRFKRCVRESDTIARVGGDEFTVILEAIHNEDDPRIVAEKLLNALAVRVKVNNQAIPISASIGITLYPFDDTAELNLLKKADMAMYKAKELGRNRYQFYQVGMKLKE